MALSALAHPEHDAVFPVVRVLAGDVEKNCGLQSEQVMEEPGSGFIYAPGHCLSGDESALERLCGPSTVKMSGYRSGREQLS